MRAVDTNVLVRLLIRDDARQVAAAEAFVARGVWASLLVIAETMWVLREVYDREHDEIVEAIRLLLDVPSLTIQDTEVVVAALEQYRRRPALGFSDCLVLEIARKAGHLPLGTFDKDLAEADGAERL